jgi:hypothetical protein
VPWLAIASRPSIYPVHGIQRKDAVIFLGKNSQVSGAPFQFAAHWAIALCANAVAGRAIGLKFYLFDILVLR